MADKTCFRSYSYDNLVLKLTHNLYANKLRLNLFVNCFRKKLLGFTGLANEHNPLNPDIKILLTVLHLILMELVRRICLIIKTSYPWWSLSLFFSLSPLHTNYAYMRSYIQDPFRRPWKKDLRAWVLLSHLIVIYMK